MEHIERTIEDLQERIREHEQQANKLKQTVNDLRMMLKLPPLYSEEVAEQTMHSIRGDEFYGQPLASVVEKILEMRKAATQGPATVNDIYSSMIAGGYKFETKDAENAKRGLRISLTKNPKFHRLPTGVYGLTKWYPNLKKGSVDRAEKEVAEENGLDEGAVESEKTASGN